MVAKIVRCPECGLEGKETFIWTRNKYGHKYYYKKIQHEELSHYIPINRKPIMKKGYLRNIIMDILSGEGFKIRIFTIKDIAERLKYNGLDLNKLTYQNLMNSLQNLATEGFIESKTISGKKYFINKIPELGNRYQIEKLIVDLKDEIGNGTMAYHKFTYLIKNPTDAIFYYFIVMIYGDSPLSREDLKFKAGSLDENFKISYHFIQDEPKIKKILLSFNKGVKPGEQRSIWIEYNWPDSAIEYLISILVEIKILKISIISNFIRWPHCEVIDVTRSIRRTENFIIIRDDNIKSYEITVENLAAGENVLIKWQKNV